MTDEKFMAIAEAEKVPEYGIGDGDLIRFARAIERAVLAEQAGTVRVPVDPTPEMASAYLLAIAEYWHKVDELPSKPGVWRNGTPTEAFVEAYRAMIAAAPK